MNDYITLLTKFYNASNQILYPNQTIILYAINTCRMIDKLLN